MERCSFLGWPQEPDGASREEPEEHKRKEVELVDSVNELRSSSSTRGKSMPNLEVLDARIASALNKIIHNSHFRRKNQSAGTKGPEGGPFPSRQTDCSLDLRSLPGHWES